MIDNEKQLEVALRQLEGFKDLREAMRLHLEETTPTLTATVVESYDHRIHELQEEICDYLLRQRATGLRNAPEGDPASVG